MGVIHNRSQDLVSVLSPSQKRAQPTELIFEESSVLPECTILLKKKKNHDMNGLDNFSHGSVKHHAELARYRHCRSKLLSAPSSDD